MNKLYFIIVFCVVLFISIQIHEESHIQIYKTYDCDYQRNLFEVIPSNCKGDIKEMNLLTNILEQQYYQIYISSLILSCLILILTERFIK